jgi:hypothetical protein
MLEKLCSTTGGVEKGRDQKSVSGKGEWMEAEVGKVVEGSC